jgi:hypothetical protein
MYIGMEGPVLVDSHQFGYYVSDVGFERSHVERHPKVDWLVTAQLAALDSTGAVSEEVDRGQIKIKRINDAYQPSLNLRVPRRAGFYRYDIQFSDFNGNLLGSYSQYLRVVQRSVRVRLGINDRRFRPGQTIATRPEDLGTDTLRYGEEFDVQRRVDRHWRRYPPMNQNSWEAWLGVTGAGDAGSCSSFTIPTDTPKGRYRVVKHLGVDIGREQVLPLTIAAPFAVSAAALLSP